MGIDKIIILLGKRLQSNQLTLEGRSRVDALMDYLPSQSDSSTAILFCGGRTKGQTMSESQSMYEYFIAHPKAASFPDEHILLEQNSTSTVENIQHGSVALLESGLLSKSGLLEVVFVSNDYHLERVFEIQTLMDEQGLLGVLRTRCFDQGVELNISYQLSDHVSVDYPYTGLQSKLFLNVEALTTYRVYLEGVVADVFDRELASVREAPLNIAIQALTNLDALLKGSVEHEMLKLLMVTLKTSVTDTVPSMPIKKVREYLAVLDTNLTLLNRYLDPESQLETRWWR
ncbi:YdcF family protein [uncultured Vibrio sp.]|uniref:YdcF family protein n=1 Tax=uncultured Vibrio sp. TaxID=114054 RepID=UPI0025F4A2A3|nr:YdcF family protein [uncultured Vibrio sp.]